MVHDRLFELAYLTLEVTEATQEFVSGVVKLT